MAEVDAATGEVVVHEWLKKAILLLFPLRGIETIEVGPFEYADKLPLKHGFAEAGVRVVPGASARWGSFLGRGVVLMPSYVNIGAWVGADTMVDTWATVGLVRPDRRPGAPVGRRGHRRRARAAQRGAGRGRGRRLRRQPLHGDRGRPGRPGAVLGAGTILDPAIPVIDAETGEELAAGVVPAVVRGHPGQPAARVPGRGVLPAVRARDQAARPRASGTTRRS